MKKRKELSLHQTRKIKVTSSILKMEVYRRFIGGKWRFNFHMLFNRRRSDEVERIHIKNLLSHQKIDANTIGESYKTFTPNEKKAAMHYTRFSICGKLGSPVPVLLHRAIFECCKLLLKHRDSVGVHPRNSYLFGIPGYVKGDHKYLRACDLMRRFSVDCGAQQPTTLRGTILREHVATMCINFNLTDNEVSDLAKFMGHADKIHKDFYGHPIIFREILQTSKLLEAMQGDDEDKENENIGDDSDDKNNLCAIGSSPLCKPLNKFTANRRSINDSPLTSYVNNDNLSDDIFESKAGSSVIKTGLNRTTVHRPPMSNSPTTLDDITNFNQDKENSSSDNTFQEPKSKKKTFKYV